MFTGGRWTTGKQQDTTVLPKPGHGCTQGTGYSARSFSKGDEEALTKTPLPNGTPDPSTNMCWGKRGKRGRGARATRRLSWPSTGLTVFDTQADILQIFGTSGGSPRAPSGGAVLKVLCFE